MTGSRTEPRFIEVGDPDDTPAPLPIFVTQDRGEQDRRLQAVTFIRGWSHTDIDEENVRAYVEGEITLDELLGRSIPSA